MYLIAVYALNTIEQRKQLWSFLSQQIQNTNLPVLVGGDFNVVLSIEDRYQGNVVQMVEIEDFQQCLNDCRLQELRAVGPQYTWDNNQGGANTNIDRCFATLGWFTDYFDIIVERIEKNVSDHCLQLLRFESVIPRKGLFKFFNVIADHEGFEQAFQRFWTSSRTNSN